MMKLETAIDRCIDRCNLAGSDVDIYKFMYQYKAIRDLPDDQFDKVYDRIARTLGFIEKSMDQHDDYAFLAEATAEVYETYKDSGKFWIW